MFFFSDRMCLGFQSLDKVHGSQTEVYILDPKSLSKDDLYGSMDGTTLEWTDGVFTHILRKVFSPVGFFVFLSVNALALSRLSTMFEASKRSDTGLCLMATSTPSGLKT